MALGRTNALNADTIVHLPRPVAVTPGEALPFDIAYAMGGGLASFRCREAGRGGEG